MDFRFETKVSMEVMEKRVDATNQNRVNRILSGMEFFAESQIAILNGNQFSIRFHRTTEPHVKDYDSSKQCKNPSSSSSLRFTEIDFYFIQRTIHIESKSIPFIDWTVG